MSAKPSEVPSILPQANPPKPMTAMKPVGPTYNSAFASFLQNSSRATEPDSYPKSPVKNNQKSKKSESKVVVQATKPLTITKVIASVPSRTSTQVQQKQEAWTSSVLKQSQHTKPSSTEQRATCERIQQYVPGQFQVNRNGQQHLFKTTSQGQSQHSKMSGQKQF